MSRNIGSNDYTPIIRRLAISKRNVGHGHDDKNASSSVHFQTLYSSSETRIPYADSFNDFPGSCASFQDEFESSNLTLPSKKSEDILELEAIIKSKPFQMRMKECKDKISEVISADVSKIEDFDLPEPEEEESLSKNIICETVNIQRFQTDDDVIRQNYAIAVTVVEFVVDKAQRLANKRKLKCGKTGEGGLSEFGKTKIQERIAWPTIGEFNITLGAKKIQDFIKTWKFEKKWTYSINLIDIRKDGSSRFYIYDAQWCIPTLRNPIPPCTASVFFIFQVSNYLPRSYPVTVTFVLEGSVRQHFVSYVPTFNMEWILHVLEAKYQLMRKINF